MFNCEVYYLLSDKELIEDALSQLNERVFDCWVFPPKVYLGEAYIEGDEEDEQEIPIILEYEDNNNYYESIRGHEAMSLVEAFVSGVLYQAKK